MSIVFFLINPPVIPFCCNLACSMPRSPYGKAWCRDTSRLCCPFCFFWNSAARALCWLALVAVSSHVPFMPHSPRPHHPFLTSRTLSRVLWLQRYRRHYRCKGLLMGPLVFAMVYQPPLVHIPSINKTFSRCYYLSVLFVMKHIHG